MTFKELSEDKDAMKGDMLTFTGEVIQIKDNLCRFNVQKRTWGYSETVLFTFKGEPTFKEKDIIQVWGESDGMYTYTSAIGAEVTVPKLEASYIEVKPS